MEPDEPIEHELLRRGGSRGDGHEHGGATKFDRRRLHPHRAGLGDDGGAVSKSAPPSPAPAPPTQPIRTPPKDWNPSRLDRCPGTRLTPISNTHA